MVVGPLFRNLLVAAARKAATSPAMQDKAQQAARGAARVAAPKLRQAAEELDHIAKDVDPKRHPARFAGRVVGRLFREPRDS